MTSIVQDSENSNSSQEIFSWVGPMRYFEKRPTSYAKSIIALGVLFSLLAYFFGEPLLVVVVWVSVFVFYVRSMVPPVETEYKISKFGVQMGETIINYKQIHSFSVEGKKNGYVLRFYLAINGQPLFAVLPLGYEQYNEAIRYLKDALPYLDKIPKSDSERFIEWLARITGLGV